MTNDHRERWGKLISDWESTDLSQAEFARERGVSVHSLRYWRYHLRKEAKAVGSPSEQLPAGAAPKEDLRLLTVRAVGSAPKARWPVPSRDFLELLLPSGACVRFLAGTDPKYLRALMAAL